MLHVLDEDAGHCCRKGWQKLADSGALDSIESYTCGKCEVEYRAGDGLIRLWRAHVWTVRM